MSCHQKVIGKTCYQNEKVNQASGGTKPVWEREPIRFCECVGYIICISLPNILTCSSKINLPNIREGG